MKFLITIVISTVLFLSTEMIAQNRTITATVINISSNDGKVGFALYNKATFMQTPIQGKDVEIINGKSVVIFKNVVPGEYAVVCYHDKNNNGKNDAKNCVLSVIRKIPIISKNALLNTLTINNGYKIYNASKIPSITNNKL